MLLEYGSSVVRLTSGGRDGRSCRGFDERIQGLSDGLDASLDEDKFLVHSRERLINCAGRVGIVPCGLGFMTKLLYLKDASLNVRYRIRKLRHMC